MTVEYVVLGAILIVMGAVQTWLRHGPWGKEMRAGEAEVAARRAEVARAAARAEATAGTDVDGAEATEAGGAHPGYDSADEKAYRRSGKAWSGWTAILGGVSMVFGLTLLVLGLLGY
jgi:hypothetical protein